MSRQRRWAIALATSAGLFGLTLTSGLAVLANYFVREFSRPHIVFPDMDFTWSQPLIANDPPPSQQRFLLFKAADGTLLCGDFWAQPQLAPTIILCHGYRVARTNLRPAAALEYACGYNVLCFDFRGHGDSESVMTSAGNAEVRDLEAALFVASRQPETMPGKIIIHGFSMGASVALLTPPHQDVVAIIADSPYARSDDILRRLVYYRLVQEREHWPWLHIPPQLVLLLAWCIVAASTVVFRLRFGFNVVARPDTSFRRWRARSKRVLQRQSIPILLIHSAGDTLIPIDHARQIAAEAKAQGVQLETYFVAAEAHCGAFDWDPHEYQRIIRSFLAQHLQDALPILHRNLGA